MRLSTRRGKPFHVPAAVLLLLSALLAPFATAGHSPSDVSANNRPNIIFIVTDDMDSAVLDHMPRIDALLRRQGTSFSNFMVSMPSCCPSRASILRGQYVHNHEIRGNKYPTGGAPKFFELGHEESTIATWLQDTGLRTGLFGKYMNDYEGIMPEHVPPGWDEWFAWAGDGKYFDYLMNENGVLVEFGAEPHEYETDVIAAKARQFVQDSAAAGRPFFAYVSPHAPHEPNIPAPRHADAFPGATSPRSPSFNEADLSDKTPGKSWLRDQPLLTEEQIAQGDALYRRRLQTMLAVDELVETLIATLDETGELENTYVIFTSDNGYLSGEHRLAQGKGLPYEESIRVPLLVRGPGVPAGRVESRMASNIDLAPTLAALVEAPVPAFVDGRSLLPLLVADETASWRQSVLIEMIAKTEEKREAKRAERQAAKEAAQSEDAASSSGADRENRREARAARKAAKQAAKLAARQAVQDGGGSADLDVDEGASSNSNNRGRQQESVDWDDPRVPLFRVLRTEDFAYIEFDRKSGPELYDLRADPYQLENLISQLDEETRQRLSNSLAELAVCAAESCRAAEDAPLEIALPGTGSFVNG